MTAKLWEAPTVNNWRVPLASAINLSETIVGLVSTASFNPSQLVVPGILVIDRVDTTANENPTPNKREYISFASISGATLYGVSRGLGGSNDQSHTGGSWVEAISSVDHWNDLLDFLLVDHTITGGHDVFSHVRSFQVTGISGLSGLKGDVVMTAGANVSIYPVSGPSGYAAIAITASTGATAAGGIPMLSVYGPLFPGTNVTPAVIIEDPLTLISVSAALFSPPSGASLLIDVNKNGTSIFASANRPGILAGGTFVSTASLSTTTLLSGDLISLDIDNAGGNTLTVLLET